jgi:hypothetical protein
VVVGDPAQPGLLVTVTERITGAVEKGQAALAPDLVPHRLGYET